ncbi:MAG: preprotein translocase subunit SecE [Bdellovibrionales bacterium]|nr:preprotein translocase subunit SecE [Bdellovibrionales bacterium]
MNKLSKYVNALFLLAAALVWLVSKHYVAVAIGYFQLGRKIGVGADAMGHIIPLVLAVLTFVILSRTPKSSEFTSDAVGELARVSWPTARDVRIGTIVVIITVIVAGVFLGLVDIAFTAVIRGILGA